MNRIFVTITYCYLLISTIICMAILMASPQIQVWGKVLSLIMLSAVLVLCLALIGRNPAKPIPQPPAE